jgi:hypothetical protein
MRPADLISKGYFQAVNLAFGGDTIEEVATLG